MANSDIIITCPRLCVASTGRKILFNGEDISKGAREIILTLKVGKLPELTIHRIPERGD